MVSFNLDCSKDSPASRSSIEELRRNEISREEQTRAWLAKATPPQCTEKFIFEELYKTVHPSVHSSFVDPDFNNFYPTKLPSKQTFSDYVGNLKEVEDPSVSISNVGEAKEESSAGSTSEFIDFFAQEQVFCGKPGPPRAPIHDYPFLNIIRQDTQDGSSDSSSNDGKKSNISRRFKPPCIPSYDPPNQDSNVNKLKTD